MPPPRLSVAAATATYPFPHSPLFCQRMPERPQRRCSGRIPGRPCPCAGVCHSSGATAAPSPKQRPGAGSPVCCRNRSGPPSTVQTLGRLGLTRADQPWRGSRYWLRGSSLDPKFTCCRSPRSRNTNNDRVWSPNNGQAWSGRGVAQGATADFPCDG